MTLHLTQKPDGSAGQMDGNGNPVVMPTFTETITSTATVLSPYGLGILSSTGAKTFIMAAPVLGSMKEFVKTANSTAIITISVGSGQTVGGSTKVVTKILFNGQNDSCSLRGISATKWHVISNNSVTLST